MKSLKILCLSLVFPGLLLSCENANGSNPGDDGKTKKEQKKNKTKEVASTAVEVVKKWDLPEILLEVSGITYLGNNQFACVQDEDGVIFIYNTVANKIERSITFGAAGDYEGIAVVGRTAYVVRSDGKIYEVDNLDTKSPKVTEHDTPLTAANNVEGLTYDAKQNRLLLAIKGAEAGSQTYKGVYAFNLSTKKMAAQPLFKIDLNDTNLKNNAGKKLNNALQPSEIAVHPKNGNIYLTEGANPQLFILSPTGKILARHKLDDQVFNQPEGITFSPAGEMYISNEGKKEPGNILQVRLKSE
ncbi:MAG: hypothetical protein ACO1OF_00165 [Adhaeribacter sp.]